MIGQKREENEGFETDLEAFEEDWNQRSDVFPSGRAG